MTYTEQDLPPLPATRLMAFDEAIEIRAYNKDDMRKYAMLAVNDYIERGGSRKGFLARLIEAFHA